jgi:hypothetical protein
MIMSEEIHVVRDSNGWRVRGPDAAASASAHGSKADAVAVAKASASQSGLAKVVVHNEDGTIDYVEHGHGTAGESPEDFRTPSGSDLKAVDAKVNEALSRGIEAVIKQRMKKLNNGEIGN